jgi:hypothetical protein
MSGQNRIGDQFQERISQAVRRHRQSDTKLPDPSGSAMETNSISIAVTSKQLLPRWVAHRPFVVGYANPFPVMMRSLTPKKGKRSCRRRAGPPHDADGYGRIDRRV